MGDLPPLPERTCTTCGVAKPLDSKFYVFDRRRDEFQRRCRACNNIVNRENAAKPESKARKAKYVAENRAKQNEYNVVYRARTIVRQRESGKAWREQNRLKRKAHSTFWEAIQAGRVVKLPCACCGAPEVEGHHPDYSRPLDVIWLCRPHHIKLHAEHAAAIRARSEQGKEER